ncbi:hypothetical protein WJX72_003693 [[Myrmecia] bisecta]|uniref:Uncharacterized protein n=1 Tax=[Myrmecia] bisecta TaxID=41462 RepID=A0AAW1PP60_9CHLO
MQCIPQFGSPGANMVLGLHASEYLRTERNKRRAHGLIALVATMLLMGLLVLPRDLTFEYLLTGGAVIGAIAAVALYAVRSVEVHKGPKIIRPGKGVPTYTYGRTKEGPLKMED